MKKILIFNRISILNSLLVEIATDLSSEYHFVSAMDSFVIDLNSKQWDLIVFQIDNYNIEYAIPLIQYLKSKSPLSRIILFSDSERCDMLRLLKVGVNNVIPKDALPSDFRNAMISCLAA